MNTRLSHFLLASAAAIPALAHAQAGAPPIETGSSLLQVVLSLIVVVALLVGCLYVLKRLSAPRGAGAGLLRVIAAVAVGTRERVVVVEVGDTWLVLGVAPGSVSALRQLPRQEAPVAGPAIANAMNFAEWLKQMMERRRAG